MYNFFLSQFLKEQFNANYLAVAFKASTRKTPLLSNEDI